MTLLIWHDLSVIPAKAGILPLHAGSGFRVKPGMTMSRFNMCRINSGLQFSASMLYEQMDR
jgi:hypothetical protein